MTFRAREPRLGQARAFFLDLIACLLAAGLSVSNAIAQEHGLEDLYEPGFVVDDRNGDAFVDFVNAELVLGTDPSPDVIAAASDIVARLGFETMAMNLPITEERGGVPVVVGVDDSLPASLGVVEVTGDGVRVLGGDPSGLRAAAAYAASRLPYVWDLESDTLSDVIDAARARLRENGLTSERILATRVHVRSDAEELIELGLTVVLTSSDAVSVARNALGGLSFAGVAAIAVSFTTGDETSELRIARTTSPEPKDGPVPERPGSGPKHNLDLSNLYTPDGLLGDSDTNLISDRLDTVLSPADVPYANDGALPLGTVNLAARLGLESAGVSIPLVKLASEIEEPSDEPTLVLIGNHPRTADLVEEDKTSGETLSPGAGRIEVVPGAFGPKGALVITGGDDEGLERALSQVAERFPNLWERGRDRATLEDVELDLWKFFSGRSPSGQAAMALYKIDRLTEQLSDETLEAAHVLVSLEDPDSGLDAVIRERATALGAGSLDITIDDRNVQNAATVLEESFELPSEVDDFYRLFRERVLPRVRRGRAVTLKARLSEPRELRRTIEDEVRAELLAKGARENGTTVRVLSAYKQGYSWLEEVVGPALRERAGELEELTVRFARYSPPEEWPQQAMHTPVRWLHEIFPIDEILARDLALASESIRFEMAPEGAPPYEVVAKLRDGSTLFRDTFAPKVVVRPYLDRFPDYEFVRVTTGWLTASVGEEVVVDQRIATDPERFWDHYQSQTLESIYRYVMERHEGNPRGGGLDAPFFGELEVEITMSEPHERLELDNELVSSIDALHEDIYFTTLMFFRILGRNARGNELTYAGRVLPVIQPKSDGSAAQIGIRFTGFATSRPAVVVDYETTDGESRTARLDIPKIAMDRPSAMAAKVRAGTEGLERLEVRVKVDTESDERDELITRARAESVDETILSAAQVVAVVENLEELRSRGLYLGTLAYDGLRELQIDASWTHEITAETRRSAILSPNGVTPPGPDVDDYIETPFEHTGERLVQWDTPIPPPEAYALLAKMATFEEANVYKVGESYLGKEVWAMDLMSPIEASHFSIDKATTLKPTVIYSARQHANEVSSTSHVLRMAELLLTDEDHRPKLDKVNVIVHPITNPDGAQLAYDLYELTPDLILHAGYLASLGMDVTSGSDEPMPLYPEAAIRPRLWRLWRPDIFLNPHGYPSHQLVQLFSEYTGLVRGGRMTERNWSMNKGWFLPGFDYLDDPRYPRHKDAAFRIRDYITEAINSAPEVYSMNQRNYERYRRYGGEFDPKVFKLPMVNDVLIHTAIKGSKAPSPGSNRGYNPKVTIWSGSTEAPDETAYGDWLQLVATAGLKWDQAILQYLVDGEHEVERKASSFWKGVSLSLDRPRPPKGEEDDTNGGQSAGESRVH